MKTAADLLRDYINLEHADPEAAVSLFAEDGSLEAPYFASLGHSWRFSGSRDLRGAFTLLLNLYPGLRFENLRMICATPDVAIGEYEFIAKSTRTGRTVHQLSIATVWAENGKIRVLREFQNIAEIALALLPNGLGDLEIPQDRELTIGQYSAPNQLSN